MKEPTSEQCSKNEVIEVNGAKWLATFYPQMGGYGGRCLVDIGARGSCFDVLIWHDGEFPFSEDNERGPIRLHHCDADQFIRFGELVKATKAEVLP